MAKTNSSGEEKEALKVVAISLGLLVAQIILNGFGQEGIAMIATLYFVAIIISTQLVIDRNGVEWVSKGEELTSSEHFIRAGIDIAIVFMGLVLWFIIGLGWGLSNTFKGHMNTSPKESVKALSRNNIIIKLVLTEISHLTMFAFAHLWLNLYKAAEVAWSGN